ncbi:peptidyl-prolyl cis-trans isomerase FKBP16-1, chloroplastic isoform X1 [Gossypium australe]|uniref:peptidylprolyl isomerase n=1 Tax=Gossypium australe TaxID=47621 RepID=A0A5B6VEB2_9ROSI|nr:peptidyl-prolyl cis-trans isomerase FKBP16-1, chloroplastic isoform X1 [Gossypium australe]
MHLQLQALPFQTLQQLPCSFNFPPRQHKDVTIKGSHSRHPSVSVKSLPRRVFLQLMGFSPISLCIYPLFAAPMQDMNEPEVIRHSIIFILLFGDFHRFSPKIVTLELNFEVLRTLKLSSGVRIQGEGPEARDGDYVQVNYVCRRSNGYFVQSTVDQFSGESSPVTLPLDENQIIKGLKDVLTGMKVGGKRRALIPPSVGYINENLKPIPDEFGPRRSLLSHAKEPLIFEVQLLKIL